MLKVSSGSLKKYKELAERAQARASKMAHKAENVVERVGAALEVSGAAFGMGVVQGRYGGIELVGVPIELVIGAGLNGLGMFAGERYAGHMHNLGNGSLAAYTVNLGRGMGMKWKAQAALPPGAAAALPKAAAQGETLSERELAALARD